MKPTRWRIATASTKGTSHEKTGAPCQDSHLAVTLGADDEVLVLIAADGAGSASHSDEGSSIACNELVGHLRSALDGGLMVEQITRAMALDWVNEVLAVLQKTAEDRALDVRDFACTLLAAIVSPSHAAFLQVGDGAIVLRPHDDTWSYVFWPQHGEFINTTHFITDPSSIAQMEFDVIASPITEIAVFTDGIEPLVLHYASQSVHAPFFDRIFEPVRAAKAEGVSEVLSAQLSSYLSSSAVCDRTDDDKTLLLATRTLLFQSAEDPHEVLLQE
jgi:hypothetical protein